MTTAIAVIAKSPVPGQVKTRMHPALDHAEAANLAGRLLLDVVDQATATGADVWCSYAGPPSPLRALLPTTVMLLEQRGADLAERLRVTQDDLFSAGYSQVVLLGGDCPTVGTAQLEEALGALRRDPDAVLLGPAADGGYTLLATAVPTPHLFDGVEMSTDRVLAETVERALRAGARVTLLAVRHDLDTAADLVMALAAGQLDAAPRTRAVAECVARLTPLTGGGGSCRS